MKSPCISDRGSAGASGTNTRSPWAIRSSFCQIATLATASVAATPSATNAAARRPPKAAGTVDAAGRVPALQASAASTAPATTSTTAFSASGHASE
jgi:hypothetical protein